MDLWERRIYEFFVLSGAACPGPESFWHLGAPAGFTDQRGDAGFEKRSIKG